MLLQGHYLRKFPALYIIIINRMVACAHRVALVVLRGDQAASAESCTHPAKRDHRFPPPIAERQRLPNVRINTTPALVRIMAWRWPGDKPLSEPMMVRLPTHICVTRPERVNKSVGKCRNTLSCLDQYTCNMLRRCVEHSGP